MSLCHRIDHEIGVSRSIRCIRFHEAHVTMANLRRNTEAAQRAAARKQREDDAPRLLTEVPNLESLRLEIDVRRETGTLSGGTHIRRVVVENAPALFFVPCADRDCNDGGHDLTREIMTALRKNQ